MLLFFFSWDILYLTIVAKDRSALVDGYIIWDSANDIHAYLQISGPYIQHDITP